MKRFLLIAFAMMTMIFTISLTPAAYAIEDEVQDEPAIEEVIFEDAETITEKFLDLVSSVYTWVIVGLATVITPTGIFFVWKAIKAFKDLRNKQADGEDTIITLIGVIEGLLNSIKGMHGDQLEQKKLLAAIVAMSNFDPLKKEHLLDKVKDINWSVEDFVKHVKQEAMAEVVNASTEVKDILGKLGE